MLDAFANLEAIVCKLLKAANNEPPKNQPFRPKLDEFAKITGISQIATANLHKLALLVAEIKDLLPVRADIVHSHMQISNIDGTPSAMFTNSQNACETYPSVRILTLRQLHEIEREVLKIVDRIKALNRP